MRVSLVGMFVMACVTPRVIVDKNGDTHDSSGDTSADTADTGDSGDTADTSETGGDTGDDRPSIVCLEAWSTESGQAGVYVSQEANESWDFGTTNYLVEGWDVPDGGPKLCNTLDAEFAGVPIIFNGWDDPGEDPAAYAADRDGFADWGSYLVYSCTAQGAALLYDEATGRCADVTLTVDGHNVREFHPNPLIYNLYYAPGDGGAM